MIKETNDKVWTMEYVDKEYTGKIICKGLEYFHTVYAPFDISLLLKVSYKTLSYYCSSIKRMSEYLTKFSEYNGNYKMWKLTIMVK